jgi:beta-lactam-binding protein with PASTA domain
MKANVGRGKIVLEDGNEPSSLSAPCVAVTVITTCTVPNVVDVLEATAITAIEDAGLTAGTPTTACSDSIAAGNVISTDPAAGATPTCGSTVEIVTSLGSPTVPDVTAMNEAGAIAAINAVVGLTAGTPTYECNNVEAAGEVLRQSPGPGVATCGTTVDIVVSKVKPVVPNVVDMTQAEAMTALGAVADITVNPVVYNGWSASVAVGDVMAQEPAAGETTCGKEVTLQVSSSLTAPANPMPCDGNDTQQCADAAAYIANGWDPNAGTQGSGGWNKPYHPYGDAMGNTEIMFQNYRVYNTDLALLLDNWARKAGAFPPGANPAADVAHNAEILFQNYRVYNKDLERILCYWAAKDADLNANPRGLGPWTDANNSGWTCP